jgi:hypothetical protein
MCIRCREIERDLGYLRQLRADTKDHLVLLFLGETINDLQSEKPNYIAWRTLPRRSRATYNNISEAVSITSTKDPHHGHDDKSTALRVPFVFYTGNGRVGGDAHDVISSQRPIGRHGAISENLARCLIVARGETVAPLHLAEA